MMLAIMLGKILCSLRSMQKCVEGNVGVAVNVTTMLSIHDIP